MKIIIKTIHDIYTINISELTISINDLICKIAEKEQVNKQNIRVLYDTLIVEYSLENNIYINSDCNLFIIVKKI